jgi:hypothetical protein
MAMLGALGLLIMSTAPAEAGSGEKPGYPAPTDTPRHGITMTVHPAFDGWYRPGAWVELLATIENSGDDTTVDLQVVDGSGHYSVPVELPRGAAKRVPIAFHATTEVDRVTASVYRGETMLVERVVIVRAADPADSINVVLADDPTDVARPLTDMSEVSEPYGGIKTVTSPPEDVPEHSLAMQSIVRIIVGEADLTGLSAAQRDALLQWVALGGTLVLPGGPALPAALAALPEAMRPGESSGVREVVGLEDPSAPEGMPALRWTQPVTVADLAPAAGASVDLAADEGKVPLVVSRAFGDGMVVALAYDPTVAPFDDWRDVPWQRADATTADSAPLVRTDALQSALMAALGQTFRLPSAKWSFAIIGLFIVLVGPVNYLVLRRRRRLDLAWVTIPALTLVASLASYGVGYGLYGGEVRQGTVSVVRTIPDAGIAHVTSFVAVFSPGSREYDITVETPGALSYFDTSNSDWGSGWSGGVQAKLLQGRVGGVRDLRVDQWSAGGFVVEAVVPWTAGDPGALRVEAGKVKGEVRNPFGRALRGAELVVHGDHVWYGALPTEFAADYDRAYVSPRPLNLDFNLLPADGRDDREERMRVGLVEAATRGEWPGGSTSYRPGSPSYYGNSYDETDLSRSATNLPAWRGTALFAFDDQAPIEAGVRSGLVDRVAYTMYTAAVPLEVPGDTESAPIATALPIAAVDGAVASGNLCGPDAVLLSEKEPYALFTYNVSVLPSLPSELWLTVTLPKPPSMSVATGMSRPMTPGTSRVVVGTEEWKVDAAAGAGFGHDPFEFEMEPGQTVAITPYVWDRLQADGTVRVALGVPETDPVGGSGDWSEHDFGDGTQPYYGYGTWDEEPCWSVVLSTKDPSTKEEDSP